MLLIPIFMVELIPIEIKKRRNSKNSSRKTNQVSLQNVRNYEMKRFDIIMKTCKSSYMCTCI